MGLWGAAQAIAFGAGGLIGAAASDLTRWLLGEPGVAYAAVFGAEALLFIVSARLAARIGQSDRGEFRIDAEGACADPRHDQARADLRRDAATPSGVPG